MNNIRTYLAAAVFAIALTLAGGTALAGHHESAAEGNPCAANPCNPCAATGAENPCNPCAQNPCQPQNPCNPCQPQADEEE